MIKRILSLTITLSLLLGVFSISFADTDQTPDDRANVLLKAGVINGYRDGTLGLERPITRAEFSSMLEKIIIDDEEDMDEYKNHSYFSDIDADNWSASSINILFDKGIVNGYKDGTFRPNNEISFNEIIVMVVRSKDIEVDAGDTWSEGYVNKAKELGMLKNVKETDYSKSANRQNVVDILYSIIETSK